MDKNLEPDDTPTVGRQPMLQRESSLPKGTGQLNPEALNRHAKISSQDRQRLLRDLSGTGSLRRNIKIDKAPVTIKQFLRGEIDLNTELSRRFASAPLITTIAREPQDARSASRSTAMLSTQDNSSTLTIDVFSDQNITEATFTMNHMMSMRFRLPGLSSYDKRSWLELMKRDAGAAFLWTNQRWENDYFIFVLRPHYVRLYGFSEYYEASVRITHPISRQLIDWLGTRWHAKSE